LRRRWPGVSGSRRPWEVPAAARRATLVATWIRTVSGIMQVFRGVFLALDCPARGHCGLASRRTRSATPALDTAAAYQGFGAYEDEGGRAAALIRRRRSWTEAAPMTRPAILPSGEITSVLGRALMGMSWLNSAAIRSPGSFQAWVGKPVLLHVGLRAGRVVRHVDTGELDARWLELPRGN
jgi:hypothetical protein